MPKEQRRRICNTCYTWRNRLKAKHVKEQGEQRKRQGTILDMDSCLGLLHQALGIMTQVFGTTDPTSTVLNEQFFLQHVRAGPNAGIARQLLGVLFQRSGGLRLNGTVYTRAQERNIVDFLECVRHEDRLQLAQVYGFSSDSSTFRLVCIQVNVA
jgi:hypothetical protein